MTQNVTLSPETLATLTRRITGQSPIVFPREHLIEPKKTWGAVLQRASLRRLIILHPLQLGEQTAQLPATASGARKRHQKKADSCFNLGPLWRLLN